MASQEYSLYKGAGLIGGKRYKKAGENCIIHIFEDVRARQAHYLHFYSGVVIGKKEDVLVQGITRAQVQPNMTPLIT